MSKRPTKIAIEFDDGSVETHVMSDTSYYRNFYTHQEDPNVKGRIIAEWRQHLVGWSDERITRQPTTTTAESA